MKRAELLQKVESVQQMLIARATGDQPDPETYTTLRKELLQEISPQSLLPTFVRECRDLGQFWGFISTKSPTYQGRREFIWTEFRPLIDVLENPEIAPVLGSVSESLGQLDAEHVHQIWQHALDRRQDDPAGAITAARALLESVCKNILDTGGISYPDDADLPKLYARTAEYLHLAPSQHTEKIFRQILGGCQAVVEGLGAVRNRLGDAHGQGKQPVRPASRHAELAVNLAGAMAVFLIQTWEHRKAEEVASSNV